MNRTSIYRTSRGKLLCSLALPGLLLLCLHFHPVLAQPAAQPTSFDNIDTYVQSEMKAGLIPGLAYAVVKGNEVVHLQAFGVADSTGRPITSQTPFLIGSVGKIITSLAIQQLVSRGQVELDAPVQRYIPWFTLADPDAARRITIRHLLTHTSGLSNGSGVNPEYSLNDRLTNLDIVRGLSQVRLDRPVGSTAEYSNLNFVILGQVIEKVSGQTYEAYIQEHVFEPLEMQRSYMDIAKAQQNGLAQGHRILFGFLTPVQVPYPRGMVSAGYHLSNIEDMSHLLIAHLNQGFYKGKSVLSQNGVQSQVANNKLSYYDIHWLKLESMPSGYTDGQSGSTLDYSACYYTLPYYQTGVVVLTNANTAETTPTKSAQTIAFDILEMTIGASLRSGAPSIMTIYVGIDLLLLGGLMLPTAQFLGFRRWKRRLAVQPGNLWRTIVPVTVIDFVFPLVLLVGIPIVIITFLAPGLSFWSAWPFLIFVLPDIGYSLLVIAASLLGIGLIKIIWYVHHQVKWQGDF